MARLDEIATKFTASDVPEVDMESMPEERAGFRATPYPGKYGFQLPADLDYDERIIDAKDAEGHVLTNPDGTPKKLKRLVVNFNNGHELKILETTPENKDFEGEELSHRVSNAEYRMGKEHALVSEMGFLLRALKETVPKGATNVQWAQAIAKHVLGKFRAEIEWDAFCDPDRKRFVFDEGQGKNVEDTQTGCGQRYAQRAYKKGDGSQVMMILKVQEQQADGTIREKFAESFLCHCGAAIRCFPRLRRYESWD